MLKRWTSIGVALVVAVSLVVVFLARYAKPAAAEKTGTFVIGAITPMSGLGASWGIPQTKGLGMAVDSINKAGGVRIGDTHYAIDLKLMDSKLDTAEAVSCCHKLIEQYKVKAIFTSDSAAGVAIRDIRDAAKVIGMDSGWSRDISKGTKYQFRFQPGSYETSLALYRYIKKIDGPGTKIAVLDPDYEGGWADTNYVKSWAKKYNLDLVFSEFYTPGTKDFTPILTKLLRKKPSYIDAGCSGGDYPILIKQAYDMGYRGTLIYKGDTMVRDMLEIAGPERAFGVHATFGLLDFVSKKATSEQRAVYKKVMETVGYVNTLLFTSYDGVFMLKQAWEGSGSLDADVVCNWLRTHEWHSIARGENIRVAPEAAGIYHGNKGCATTAPVSLVQMRPGGIYESWCLEAPEWESEFHEPPKNIKK